MTTSTLVKNESAGGNRDHEKGKVVSLRLKSSFYGNSEKCEILSWAVGPIASISIADISSSDQTKVQRLLHPTSVGSETDGRVYFQFFRPTL